MSEPGEAPLRAESEFRQRNNRQFVVLALATAPLYLALALVTFSPFPVVGWVLYVIGVAACATLIARATGWLRHEDPRMRALALITFVFGIATPVVTLLGILFIKA